MSNCIIENSWDSKIIKSRAGTIQNCEKIPNANEISNFDFVNVRIPVSKEKLLNEYFRLGFVFISIDISMQKTHLSLDSNYQDIQILSKMKPSFKIEGFNLKGSRFFVDESFRLKMPPDYWDLSILDHIQNFADYCICAVNQENELIGFISCFEKSDVLNLFLIIIHPNYQSQKIGLELLKYAEKLACEKKLKLTTSVLIQNDRAIKFYLKFNFEIESSNYVLHYWKKI